MLYKYRGLHKKCSLLPNRIMGGSPLIFISSGAPGFPLGPAFQQICRALLATVSCGGQMPFNIMLTCLTVPAWPARAESFRSIYACVGRGPTVPLTHRRGFLASAGSPYKACIRARTALWSDYKAAILGKRMAYLVLWPSLFGAHYVNGIGFLEYHTGERYARIIDNWNNTVDRYYCWDSLICRFMGYMYLK